MVRPTITDKKKFNKLRKKLACNYYGLKKCRQNLSRELSKQPGRIISEHLRSTNELQAKNLDDGPMMSTDRDS